MVVADLINDLEKVDRTQKFLQAEEDWSSALKIATSFDKAISDLSSTEMIIAKAQRYAAIYGMSAIQVEPIPMRPGMVQWLEELKNG